MSIGQNTYHPSAESSGCKALGATVIATAGSDEKLQVAKRAGADVLINYRDEGWPDAVREATGGRGVDVVFDPVGLIVQSTKCIAWNGRIVVVGFTQGDIPKVGGLPRTCLAR